MKMNATESRCSLDDRPWLSGRVPDGYWDVRGNRSSYLDWLGRRLGFVSPEDWYQLRAAHFIQNHGAALFWHFYDSSVYCAMRDCRPQHEWLPWLFSKTPKGYWHEAENRLSFMEWIEKTLQIESEECWYRVTRKSFAENGGGGLLTNHYRGSILAALREWRPDHDWKPWLFPKVPHGFWQEAENRRSYMDWLGGVLQIKREEDWYQVPFETFAENGGATLIQKFYRGSILAAVCECRPNHDWKPWLFPKVPHGFWSQPENRRRYLEWLADRLQFRAVTDWHRLTQQDLDTTGGAGLFYSHYGRSMAKIRRDAVSMRLCACPTGGSS